MIEDRYVHNFCRSQDLSVMVLPITGQAHLIALIFYLTAWYQEIHREIFSERAKISQPL
jgi:hypothetical protein